jgi:hypothetical protein
MTVYEEYEKLLHEEIDKRGQLPHCDMYVLHSPGTCEYCDKWSELQKFRLKTGIAFTNEEPKHGQVICPAVIRRNMETIERWPGNIATVNQEI